MSSNHSRTLDGRKNRRHNTLDGRKNKRRGSRPSPARPTTPWTPAFRVSVRLPGKGNLNSHCARPVHLIITMIKWIRTSRLSIEESLSRVPGFRFQVSRFGFVVSGVWCKVPPQHKNSTHRPPPILRTTLEPTRRPTETGAGLAHSCQIPSKTGLGY